MKNLNDTKYSLRKYEIIRKKSDIILLFSKSVAYTMYGNGVRIMYRFNSLPYSRALFSCVRKYGIAVARNRCKRFAREVFRTCKSYIVKGYDIAFIFFPTKNDSFSVRHEQMLHILARAQLLNCTVDLLKQ